MPLGEDIPMLIPISIVLTVFIVFLIALISNFSEQADIVRTSQVSLNMGDYLVNAHPQLSLGMSKLNGTYLNSQTFPRVNCPNNCGSSGLSQLLNTSYSNIAVMIETDTGCWCWNTASGNKVITNTFPALIVNGSRTIPARVVVSVAQ